MLPQQQLYSTAFVALLAVLIAIFALTTYYFVVDSGVALEPWEDDQEWTLVIDNEDSSANQDITLGGDNVLHAWDDASVMGKLFPNLNQLRAAWEVHPLLSKVSFSRPRLEAQPLHSIPSIFHDRASLRIDDRSDGPFKDPLLSLFSVDDTVEVLSHINNEYRSAYNVLKHSVHLPHKEYSIDEITRHFHQEGYSVVINEMSLRWKPIAKMTRQLEEELGALLVNANLYLTPEVSSDEAASKGDGAVRWGFEAHRDLMDVIVVQLAGRKRWSVAQEPTVYLSSRDKQREPTKEEEEYYVQHNRYRDFTLCPGDVLYIPRGHIHNASTVAFDRLKRKWMDWDACPPYAEGIPEAQSLVERINMPSLHLTFGIWPDITVEALVHHALHGYYSDQGSDKNTVAIPATPCTSATFQRVLQDDVKWQSVLHHSIAEVARRENDCDNPSQRGIVAKHPRECDAVLRRSVPLLLLKNNELVREGEMDTDVRLLGAKQAYLKALDMFRSSSSMPRTIDFLETHLSRPHSQPERAFRFPGSESQGTIVCPRTLRSLSDKYPVVLDDFVQYAEANFHLALKRLNVDGKKARDHERRIQKLDLERVGQGGDLESGHVM